MSAADAQPSEAGPVYEGQDAGTARAGAAAGDPHGEETARRWATGGGSCSSVILLDCVDVCQT